MGRALHTLVLQLVEAASVATCPSSCLCGSSRRSCPYSVSLEAMAQLAYWLPRSLWRIAPARGLHQN